MLIREITAEETHPLRRSVLRGGDPASDVHFSQDDQPGTFHLGAVLDGDLVGVASFARAATPYREGGEGWQLRGMAVAPEHQGRSIGSLIIDAAVTRLRELGATVLWCNARDTAIGFYETLGFTVHGDGFSTPVTGLPHHAMVRDL